MYHTITYGGLTALLVDFVDHHDGLLFLRMVGEEPTINAIWARLSARDYRGKKYNSGVTIPRPDSHIPQYVGLQKRTHYKMLRTPLASGLIDMVLLHPRGTVGEDDYRGFYLLTYAQGTPAGFFDRLNRSVSIPLQPDWAEWLWQMGQQSQSFTTIVTKPVREGTKEVEKTFYEAVSVATITPLDSIGTVQAYKVRCDEQYREAWLQIIRQQLNLSIPLSSPSTVATGKQYLNEQWCVHQDGERWQLWDQDDVRLTADSLDHLLVDARVALGLPLVIDQVHRLSQAA